MIVAGYYGITLALCVSAVCMSSVHLYFPFWTITCVNVNGISPNLVCAVILWKSDLGLLMGKFHQFLTQLSACKRSVFSFPDEIFSKYIHLDFHQTWCVH